MPTKLKKSELIESIRDASSIRFTAHALERMSDRNIDTEEVFWVLKNGFSEPSKDTFSDFFDSWVYSIRGDKPVNKDEVKRLRVPITLVEGVLVVTAIDLDQE